MRADWYRFVSDISCRVDRKREIRTPEFLGKEKSDEWVRRGAARRSTDRRYCGFYPADVGDVLHDTQRTGKFSVWTLVLEKKVVGLTRRVRSHPVPFNMRHLLLWVGLLVLEIA